MVVAVILSFVRFVGVCARAVNDFLGKNGPQLAAAVSYYAIYSLFPLALAVISALGFFVRPESIEGLTHDIAVRVPISSQLVNDTLTGIVSSRHITGLVGLIGLFWAGTAVFGAIRKGINVTWGITTPRPFLQERLIDISLMLGAAVLMLISISSTAILGSLREIGELLTQEAPVNGDLFWERLASVVPPALSFIAFIGLYWILPNTRVRWKEMWPGALAATIAFEVVKNVFVWYVHTYSVYNAVYGSIGAVVALLTWVYVSAIILLFGSLITSRYATYLTAREKEEEAVVLSMRTRVRPLKREEGNYGS